MVNIRKDSLINKLRVEFTENNIFSIPTGQATFNYINYKKTIYCLIVSLYRGNRKKFSIYG